MTRSTSGLLIVTVTVAGCIPLTQRHYPVPTTPVRAVVPAPPPLNLTPTVRREVDDMTNVVRYTVTNIHSGGLELYVETREGGSQSILMIFATSPSWRYLRCHSLIANVDGDPYRLETRHSGEVFPGGVLETVATLLNPATVHRLATGQVSRLRLCNDTITLSAQAKQALLEMGNAAWASAQP